MLIKRMLENYSEPHDKKNAIKEVIQEVILAGLAKTNFFRHAAFSGGTALRIFYGLQRFSEDLDFTLLMPCEDFNLEHYFNEIINTAGSLGLNCDITLKEKQIDSNVKSAFLKSNTKELFILLNDFEEAKQVSSDEKIRITFEIDTNPPLYAKTEMKYRLLPFPYEVRVYDKPSLFAGKIHAVLGWTNRIKGRDLYDYIYYLSTKTPVNIEHLEARLKQTGTIEANTQLTRLLLIELLVKKFQAIDYALAKKDVLPFINDPSVLDIWSVDFFVSITSKIIIENCG